MCIVKAGTEIGSQVDLLQGPALIVLQGERDRGLCPVGFYRPAGGAGQNMTQLTNSTRQHTLSISIRMLSNWGFNVQKRQLLEGLDVWGSIVRHMEASRIRQSGMVMWRAKFVRGADGCSLGKVCFPALCNMHIYVWG